MGVGSLLLKFAEETAIADIDMSMWRERAELRIADQIYSLYRESKLEGTFVLRTGDLVLAIHASLPDVVLLDIGLPKMNGWLVAKQIREQSVWKRPLIIAVTGHGREADGLRSQDVGVDLHLVKPVDPEELHKLLSRFQSIVNVPAL
jgi:DNA-binding response OmpR family regulator